MSEEFDPGLCLADMFPGAQSISVETDQGIALEDFSDDHVSFEINL